MHRFVTLEGDEGFPLVLLHGMMGAAENWEGMYPHLPEHCRAIALTLPFFDHDAPLDTVPKITDYARTYLNHKGLDRFILGGNSLGGHVSLHLALEMPERVAGLVLTGSSGLFEREVTRPRGANPSREWIRGTIRGIFYDESMVTQELIYDACRVIYTRKYTRTLISIAKSAKRDNLAEKLSQVRCPVLLVWGRQDDITPPDVAEEFNSLLPNSELVWLERCGHAAMMERPREFAEALGPWWRKHVTGNGVMASASKPQQSPS
jgi:2-hydroxy-6-oxonona-2,4-dienedioate hydrolase